MKSLPTLILVSTFASFSAVAIAQSGASTRLCGPYGCELVPVPDLPHPGEARAYAPSKSQEIGARQRSATPVPTSTDLYCESMAMAFFETALDYKPPVSPIHSARVDAAQAEMLETCKSMPTVGGVEKKQREMSSQELSRVSCLGVAEGIAVAHASRTEDRLLYSKLSQSRQFFVKACATNQKQFLSDMKKYGPYHVLSKTY